MIPEAHQSNQIRFVEQISIVIDCDRSLDWTSCTFRLYRSDFFPTQWRFMKSLLSSTDVDEAGEVAPGTSRPGYVLCLSPSILLVAYFVMSYCSNFKFIDTSPLLYNGRWYLFTFVKPGALYLYYSGMV